MFSVKRPFPLSNEEYCNHPLKTPLSLCRCYVCVVSYKIMGSNRQTSFKKS